MMFTGRTSEGLHCDGNDWSSGVRDRTCVLFERDPNRDKEIVSAHA
jgi:hypothetical protein